MFQESDSTAVYMVEMKGLPANASEVRLYFSGFYSEVLFPLISAREVNYKLQSFLVFVFVVQK